MTANRLTRKTLEQDLAKAFLMDGTAVDPVEARLKAIEYIRETIECF